MRGNSFKKIKGLKTYLLCTPVIPTLPRCQQIKETGQQMLATMTFSRGVKDDLKKKNSRKGIWLLQIASFLSLCRQGSCFSELNRMRWCWVRGLRLLLVKKRNLGGKTAWLSKVTAMQVHL